MNNERKQINNKILIPMIEEAKQKLIPLFKVSKEELSKFRKPTISRHFGRDEYTDKCGDSPAYYPVENFLYFPQKNFWYKGVELFDIATIQHEVGHYIHCQLNKEIIEGYRRFSIEGRDQMGTHVLGEIVAEYGNIILGDRDYSKYPHDTINKGAFRVFNKHGPSFLPKLSRMTLDEAIREEIVKI